MRNGSIAVLREIGVETGGSNVQWAVNPEDGRMVVIEMNPRVSRSSALASKATGFPIAKIAAKLAVGYTLDELDNDITKVTPASFEPTIDYVVTKIPRFRLRKIPRRRAASDHGDEIRGRGHGHRPHDPRSLQKALASMEPGLTGFDEIDIPGAPDRAAVIKAISEADPGPDAHHRPGHAPRAERRRHPGVTMFDPWFLARIREIVEAEDACPRRPARDRGRAARAQDDGLHRCPAGQLTRPDEKDVRRAATPGRHARSFKRIDTCAAEFEAQTPYMYSTYEAP
jgi:carbamoyl-phosphate synthase large subunit